VSNEIESLIATPHNGGPVEFWRSAFLSVTPVLAQLGKRLQGQPLQEIVFPHYLMGPLDGRQRLEFLRWHMDWHIKQINSRGDPSFPKSAQEKHR
jgi:hypothetical protein